MKMFKSFAVVILLMFPTCLFAQTDFSGTWILKKKTAIEGPQYANGMYTQLKVNQRKDSLIIESSSDGKSFSRQAFAMNGSKTTFTSQQSKRKFVWNLAWAADKKTLLLTTVFYLPDNESEIDFTRTETWMMDGSTLTIDRKSLETTHETWETKGVFEKQ